MAAPEIVNVDCNLDDDYGYPTCIFKLHRALANHPLHKAYVRQHGPWIEDHPLLPEKEAEQPKRWMYVNFILDKKRKITLAIRDYDVYVVGFRNQNGRWYEFGFSIGPKKSAPFITGSTFLGCDVQYASMLAGAPNTDQENRPLAAVTLGKTSALAAVHNLSSYDEDGVAGTNTKRDLACLIVMISEPTRMFPHYRKVHEFWCEGKSLGNQLAILLHNWESMSSAMLRRKNFCSAVQKMKIVNLEKAKRVVHLLQNSPRGGGGRGDGDGDEGGGGGGSGDVGEGEGGGGRGDEGGGGGSRRSEGCPKRESKEKGPMFPKRDSSSQQHDEEEPPSTPAKQGSPRHQEEEERPLVFAEQCPSQQQDEEEPPRTHAGQGTQHQDEEEPLLIPTQQVQAQLLSGELEDEDYHDYNNEEDDDDFDDDDYDDDGDGEQLADLGRLLVEVFSVCASSAVVGTISIFDGKRGQIIYNHDEQGDALIDSQSQGNLALTGPFKAISADGRVAIKVGSIPDASDNVYRTMLWDGYADDPVLDELITKSITTGTGPNAEVTYAVMSNAVEATVQVQLKYRESQPAPRARFHGQITVHSNRFDSKSVLLFRSSEEEEVPVELLPLSDGFIIPVPLARSVIVAPLDSWLAVDVKLHAACPSYHETMVLFEDKIVFTCLQQHTIMKEIERSGVAVQVTITSEDIQPPKNKLVISAQEEINTTPASTSSPLQPTTLVPHSPPHKWPMADPVITTSVAVGWAISAAGWLVSPIISALLNKGLAHLDFNAPEKLKILDLQVLKLQRVMEVVDEGIYRVHIEPLLDKLKSSFYEAEDILDLVEYQILKKQIQDAKLDGTKMELLRKKLQSAMPSSPLKDKESGMSKLQLEKSLEKIESAISDACKVLEQLNLPGVSNDNGRRAVATSSRSAVTTAGPPLRVVGRDKDRDKIIAMLHEKEDQCQENTVSGTCYSVIGIYGIAGSGKSTLAQCVYDHEKKYKQEKMEGHFDLLMWIHVSQIFDLDSIFSEMLEGATGVACSKFSSRNVLKEKLEDKLCGKQILLVLDDVWYNIRNSEDREKLQQLISPLHVGKAGSRILVTSRTEVALGTLGAVKERRIPISDLDDEVFLEMFMHYALRDARASDNDLRILKMIGEDIAKKLKKSPLAARTVGSRLRETQTVEFWRSQKNQDLLNNTMGALWWSYQYLDEQVRRCFAYCSIFPRRHPLERDELVKLWVAEGFIKTSKPEEEMEDVAKNYFDELLSASFLQLGGQKLSYASSGINGYQVDYFTIHDLLCDLAEEVAGRDCFRIEKGCTREVPQDVRYLYVRDYNREMLTQKIYRMQYLRTLIIGDNIRIDEGRNDVFVKILAMVSGLRKLRVLKLQFAGPGLLCTIKLPASIGQMKHLRYFAFTVGGATNVALPGTFSKLYHMQVVDFGNCPRLAFSSGEDMMNLVNLRRVISSSDLDFPNVGRLIRLQILPVFIIREKKGYEPHQLKHLNKLQGKLHIEGLENVKSKMEALDVNLAAKEKLKELVLKWDKQSCTLEVPEKVLEGLCPSKYLERLDIRNYHGMTLPNWMMVNHSGGPRNLQELRLSGWSQQGPAPDFGAFIHLHSLHLYGCSWDALPAMEHLTSLKKLEISYCKNMRSLGTLPESLEKFTVTGCTPEFKRLCDDYWPES